MLLPIDSLADMFRLKTSTPFDIEKKKLDKIRKEYEFEKEEMELQCKPLPEEPEELKGEHLDQGHSEHQKLFYDSIFQLQTLDTQTIT